MITLVKTTDVVLHYKYSTHTSATDFATKCNAAFNTEPPVNLHTTSKGRKLLLHKRYNHNKVAGDYLT